MSLTTQYAPITQAGNGVATVFAFSFKIINLSDLVVTKTDASGNVTQGVLNVDYTIQFNLNTQAQSGTVTFIVPPVNGGSCTISRQSSTLQSTVYKREGVFPAKTTETALDLLTALIQEIKAALLLVNGGNIQYGTQAQLATIAAQNPTVPFHCVVTDLRCSGDYLGNPALGQNGFSFYGGF